MTASMMEGDDASPPAEPPDTPHSSFVRWLGRAGAVGVLLGWMAWAYSYFFPQDFRETGGVYVAAEWVAFMIRTFWLHLGIAATVAALAAIVARRWTGALLGLVLAFMAAWPALSGAWPDEAPPFAGGSLRVLSANVRFDNRHVDEVIDVLLQADPDVVVIQEYTTHWHRACLDRLQPHYPHAYHRVTNLPGAIALYSRLPFEEPVTDQIRPSAPGLPQLRAVVSLGGAKLAIYGIHLATPHRPDPWRRVQFAELLDQMQQDPLPLIAVGDFNFTDTSPQVDALHAAGYLNSHTIAGRGFGHTWPAVGLRSWAITPGVRIDHMYLSARVTARNERVLTLPGSDHRAIVADIGFK